MDSAISFEYLTGKRKFDYDAAETAALRCAEEGIVLLKNRSKALPLKNGENIAVFGRMQKHYLISGTGSGGRVHPPFVTDVFSSLKSAGVHADEEVERYYDAFVKEFPYDTGNGWTHPASQNEPRLEENFVRSAAARCETALFIITRTAGEDRDLKEGRGEYMLSENELYDLELLRRHFSKLVVVFNISGVIDFSELSLSDPDAVLVLWNGGMMGGAAAANVITGKVSPSGKLADTAAICRNSYPAAGHYGDINSNVYAEDIFVGYRYFTTFDPHGVLYPFGFGLSYTEFSISPVRFITSDDSVSITVRVKNIGSVEGKEVVQCYVSAPSGKLGKPKRVLAAFQKTKRLAPSETQEITLDFNDSVYASYDDTAFNWVLERGRYDFYVGNNCRDVFNCGSFELDSDVVVKRCETALAPVTSFDRLVERDGEKNYEPVPLRTDSSEQHPHELKTSVTRFITFDEVADGKAPLSDLIAQLSDEELMCIVRGEGMSSPKVTPGTAAAFVGVTPSLRKRGLPVLCCTDGPSGIRMVSDAKCVSYPSATCLACSWDPQIVREAYSYCGAELASYCVDILLGPGTNIHRDPLCGRNFEYFSEDPLLAGKMAAAVCSGLDDSGVSGCVKHFMANNQETNRHGAVSVISERAVREIYSKPFDICVNESPVGALMTSYNPINGSWAASNYDLVTKLLRNDFGFTGIVMTDWWARVDDGKGSYCTTALSNMVHAGNDIYMVTPDSQHHEDDLSDAIASGKLTRAELQACAYRLCSFALKSLSYRAHRFGYGLRDLREECAVKQPAGTVEVIDGNAVFSVPKAGKYVVKICYISTSQPLTQTNVVFKLNDKSAGALLVGSTDGKTAEDFREVSLQAGENKFRFIPETVDVTIKSLAVY